MISVVQEIVPVNPGQCLWIDYNRVDILTRVTMDYDVTLLGRVGIYLLEPKALPGKTRQSNFWQVPVKRLLQIAKVGWTAA